MTPTKQESPKNPKSPETKNTDAAAPATAPAPDASTKTEATSNKSETASKSEKSGGKSREGRRVLSVSIPEKLARQVRLLCNVTGQSAQELVEAALRRAVNKQLAGALESIKSDVEG